MDGLFHPPLSIGGRAKAGLTDRNPGNRQAEASPPGPPLIMKSGRTKGVTNKNGRNAAGYPPGFIELSNPVTTV